MARTSGGINKAKRIEILKYIQQKISDKKGLVVDNGKDYTTITLGELVETLHWENKPCICKLLKYLVQNRLLEKTELYHYRGNRCRKTQAYRLAQSIETKNIEELSNKELYPTRNYNLSDAIKIFNEETHNAAKSYGRRTFVRLGYILKHFFDWDLDRFRQWCRWIYLNGRKGTYQLLRGSKAVSLFMKQRFQNIYNKYHSWFVDECPTSKIYVISIEKNGINKITMEKRAFLNAQSDATLMDWEDRWGRYDGFEYQCGDYTWVHISLKDIKDEILARSQMSEFERYEVA